MAEFVQQNIEDMLPELEQMARVQLFTEKETRTILKRRKTLEYKLKRQVKEKQDFLNYIQYEVKVLSLVQKRRKKIGYTFKRVEIDFAIARRIHRLFRMACQRFPDDVKLWLSHVEFCQMRKEKESIGRIFTKMLSVHNRKSELWILAAKWEVEDCMSMENARSLFQRGLRFNPKSVKLWREYFRMELLNADKLRKRRDVFGMVGIAEDDEMSEAVLEGRVAQVVWKQAVENLAESKDVVASLVSFWPICQLFPWARWLEELIHKDLQEKYGDEEETWHAVALSHLEGTSNQPASEREKHQAHEACRNTYEKAVKSLPTEKMWSLYLTTCMELLEEEISRLMLDQRVHQGVDVFSRACDARLLSEGMFVKWLDLLTQTGQVPLLESVLDICVEHHPASVVLWQRRLQHQALEMDAKAMLYLFKKALDKVPERNSLPLWKNMIEYTIVHDPNSLTKLLEDGLSRCSEVCLTVKEMFLGWVAATEGLKAVRKLYKRLSATKPLSLDFFKKYIDVESAQASPKLEKLRRAYEDALNEYGASNTELWLDYIKLEMSHPQGQPDQAGHLYWRAMKMIDGQFTDCFVQQYTLLQTGHL